MNFTVTYFRCYQKLCYFPVSAHTLYAAMIPWWRNQMETFSALLAICAGNSPVPGEFPASPVNSPHKGQWRGALMFSLICVWINGWVNNRDAGDLRRYRAHYVVIVMYFKYLLYSTRFFAVLLTEFDLRLRTKHTFHILQKRIIFAQMTLHGIKQVDVSHCILTGSQSESYATKSHESSSDSKKNIQAIQSDNIPHHWSRQGNVASCQLKERNVICFIDDNELGLERHW